MQLPSELRRRCATISLRIGRRPHDVVEWFEHAFETPCGLADDEIWFLRFYSAVRCAWIGDLDAARTLLRLTDAPPLAEEFRRYLSRRPFPGRYAELFAAAGPLKSWEKVKVNKEFNEIALDAVRVMCRRWNTSARCIVDFGTGDGAFLQEVIEVIRDENRIREYDLVLIEKSPRLLAAAVRRFKDLKNLRPREIVAFGKRIESFTRFDWARIAAQRPTLAIGAASLHHLRPRYKRKVFHAISRLGCDLLVFELEGDEEARSNKSPDLLWGVWLFYNEVLRQLQRTKLRLVEKRRCAAELLMAEAMDIISQPYLKRQNFHATEANWLKYVSAGEFSSIRTRVQPLAGSTLREVLIEAHGKRH